MNIITIIKLEELLEAIIKYKLFLLRQDYVKPYNRGNDFYKEW